MGKGSPGGLVARETEAPGESPIQQDYAKIILQRPSPELVWFWNRNPVVQQNGGVFGVVFANPYHVGVVWAFGTVFYPLGTR